MVESAKSDKSPLSGSQAGFADNFPERVRAALDGRTAKWLSGQTGISTSTLSDYLKGKMPGADKAMLIAKALGVSVESLFGESDQVSAKPIADQQLGWRGLPVEPSDDLVEIAEIDLRYGLGGTFVDSHDAIESEQRQFSRAWLQRVTDSPPALLFWARGQGNSMSPTIEDGEIVLIDRSQTSPLMDDLIFACALGEIGMIKRLRPRTDHVKLLADNANVPDELAGPDDHLQIIGRVVAVVKKL